MSDEKRGALTRQYDEEIAAAAAAGMAPVGSAGPGPPGGFHPDVPRTGALPPPPPAHLNILPHHIPQGKFDHFYLKCLLLLVIFSPLQFKVAL